MIFKLENIRPEVLVQIRSMLRLHPVPQLAVWESVSRQLISKGFVSEACILLDKVSQHYGKQVGRASAERVTGFPISRRGRGISASFADSVNPALYILRDGLRPVQLGKYICLRSGGSLILVDKNTPNPRIIHSFSSHPSDTPDSAPFNDPVQWIAIEQCLGIVQNSNVLTFVDLSENAATRNPYPMASMRFERPIKRLSGPLNDGSFFVTLEPELPVFSDICRICRLDFDIIKSFWQDHPRDTCDIAAIGAVSSNILLPNIEQSLNGDCVASHSYFISCCGGMQNKEVRFIYPDGSWTTRFVHEFKTIRMMNSECGPVSLDESGHALLWDNEKVIADCQFDLTCADSDLLDGPTCYSIDWTHRRLCLFRCESGTTLSAQLKTARSCCLMPEGQCEDFVKIILHMGLTTVVMLSDGSLHFWDTGLDCVCPIWQLPHASAEASDWQALLNTKSPSIEEDPRIRILDF